MAIISEQKEIIDKKLKELEECPKYLEEKVGYYKDIIKGKIEDKSNPGKW